MFYLNSKEKKNREIFFGFVKSAHAERSFLQFLPFVVR